MTAKASRDEGRPDSSTVKEEDTVKVPETSALASQLFSTPKIFKQRCFQSPASIPNEESPYEGITVVVLCMKYVQIKDIVMYNCFSSTQWLMETRQHFPGQSQALVCLVQPKMGNYV